MPDDDPPGESPHDTDPRFIVLSEALESYAGDADDPPLPPPQGRIQAAVALVIRGGESPLDILLIKRARHDGDPWSGHIALPGGRWDPKDTGLVQTAIRETHEETGIDLSGARRLGRLSPLSPSSRHLPSLRIEPFVFGVQGDAMATTASPEVSAVHWVSLEALRDPSSMGSYEFEIAGEARSFPCFRVIEGEAIWGLTYRILIELLEIEPAGRG